MKTAKEVDKTLELAGKIASKHGHAYISTEHSCVLLQTEFPTVLEDFGVPSTNYVWTWRNTLLIHLTA